MNLKEEKFRKLIEEQQQRIRSICRHYVRNADDLDDLQQEIMINIWRNLDSFRGDASLSTWIYRIAVNTSLTYIMKEKRRGDFFLSIDKHNITHILDENGTDEKQEKELKIDALYGKINQLSVIDKLLISLSIEKVSTREMAEIIGITEPNVRTKLHRIREELKEIMKGEQDE